MPEKRNKKKKKRGYPHSSLLSNNDHDIIVPRNIQWNNGNSFHYGYIKPLHIAPSHLFTSDRIS